MKHRAAFLWFVIVVSLVLLWPILGAGAHVESPRLVLTPVDTPLRRPPIATPVPVSPQQMAPAEHTTSSETTALGSGRYHTRIGLVPHFYQDSSGVWQQIDSQLRLEASGATDEYISDHGLVQVRLPAVSGAQAVQVSATFSFSPTPAQISECPAASLAPPVRAPSLSTERPVADSLDSEPPPQPKCDSPGGTGIARGVPITVSGSLAWTPLRLTFAGASGQRQVLSQVAPVNATPGGDRLTYVEAFPGMADQYTVLPDGLKHEVILRSPDALPPTTLSRDVWLDYEGAVVLSLNLAFYADGAKQAGDFATTSQIELRDQEGNPVFYLPPAMAYEQNNPLHSTRGRYSVQHTPAGTLLSFGVPRSWLADPARHYPIVVDPTIYIWPPAADAFIWSGAPDYNYGSWADLWVAGEERSLVRWDQSAVPERAMIESSRAWLRLVTNYGSTMDVSAHALLDSWTESGVTWNSRDGTNNWNTPGSDFGSEESHVSVGTVTNTFHSWTLTDLTAEWHSGRRANYGIVLKPADYPASPTKIFGSKEGSGFKPELDVTYTLGPVSLSAYVPFAWGVPSPDWYQFSAGNGWNAIAIRPPAASDYDLVLYSDAGYTQGLAGSWSGPGELDYIVVDTNHAPVQDYYSKVYQFSERGSYQIEHATRTQSLAVGAYGPFTLTASDVIRMWDISLNAGTQHHITIRPTSGDAVLQADLFRSQSGDSSSWYQGRASRVASGGSSASGGTVSFSYSAPSNDRYGLAVTRKSAGADTSFMIYVDSTPPTGSFTINGGAAYANSADVTLSISSTDGQTGVRDMRFGNKPLQKVLVLQDSNPWGFDSIQQVLTADGIPFDQYSSSDISTIDLSPYAAVIIPSVQGDTFCNTYNNNLARFESYVQAGGVLELHVATFSGDACRLQLPGGGSNNMDLQQYNTVALPSHPLVAGVPSPFYGNYASHNSFSGYPENAVILITTGNAPGGSPTLLEYPLGQGKVVAAAQTLEWGWHFHQVAGTILENALPYVAGYQHMSPVTSVPWSLSPGDGTKNVYGQFRNNAGMWSTVYVRSIVLDTIAPSSSATVPPSVGSASIFLPWQANDSGSGVSSTTLWVMARGQWTSSGLSQSGTSGVFNYTFTQGPGTYCFATIARDRAGNIQSGPAGNGDGCVMYGSLVYQPIILNSWPPRTPVPVLNPISNPGGLNSFTISWSGVSGATSYTLEQATNGAFAGGTTIYSGSALSFVASGRGPTRYYYRVKATGAYGGSDWSNTRTVDVLWEMEPNDTGSQAKGPILSGLTYYGKFPDATDKNDIYYFDLSAKHTVEASLTNIPTGQNYDLSLLDVDLKPIKWSVQPGNADEHFVSEALDPGRYYIQVYHATSSSGNAQPYHLSVVYQ